MDSPINPYWRVEDYRIDDVLSVYHPKAEALDTSIDEFLTQYIPPDSPLQMKVAVFYCGGKSVLCIVENHMCMDGGDFKYFIKALCKITATMWSRKSAPLIFVRAPAPTSRYTPIFQDGAAHGTRPV